MPGIAEHSQCLQGWAERQSSLSTSRSRCVDFASHSAKSLKYNGPIRSRCCQARSSMCTLAPMASLPRFDSSKCGASLNRNGVVTLRQYSFQNVSSVMFLLTRVNDLLFLRHCSFLSVSARFYLLDSALSLRCVR